MHACPGTFAFVTSVLVIQPFFMGPAPGSASIGLDARDIERSAGAAARESLRRNTVQAAAGSPPVSRRSRAAEGA